MIDAVIHLLLWIVTGIAVGEGLIIAAFLILRHHGNSCGQPTERHSPDENIDTRAGTQLARHSR